MHQPGYLSLRLAVWVFLALLASSSADAASRSIRHRSAVAYPTVQELEASQDLKPGALLPRGVISSGGNFHAYYISGRQLPGGEYVVVIRLNRVN